MTAATVRRLSRYWMFTDEYTQNPYPFLAHLRREQPVSMVQTPEGLRAWVITRWDDARAALSDARMSRDIGRLYQALSGQVGQEFRPADEISNHLANSDPPRHTPLRKALSYAFTPKRVEALRPGIERVVDDLLDAAAANDPADLVAELAEPLPIITIAQLMGVPSTDWPRFRHWSSSLRRHDPTDPTGALDKDTRDLSAYMSDLIATKHAHPEDDLLSALIHADEERRLTDSEVLSTGFALMTGGNDTTMNLLSGATLALLTHPEQLSVLHGNPSLLRNAVDELLRWVSPATNALQRTTTAPVELAGVTIPAGEIVIISLASANHDETQFPDRPSELDLARPKATSLSFGHGIHYCLGSHLARAEAEILITRLFTRFPRARLAVPPGSLRYAPGMAVRPLISLPVHLH
jgi:cytochrome P450